MKKLKMPNYLPTRFDNRILKSMKTHPNRIPKTAKTRFYATPVKIKAIPLCETVNGQQLQTGINVVVAMNSYMELDCSVVL